LLDRIIELLLGLAVAAAGAFGIGTATTTPQGPPADVQHTAKPPVVTEVESAGDGLATALSAIERAMESGPDAADDGLQRAWDHVSTAGPPEDAGAPESVGRRDGAGPPEDAGSAADHAPDHTPIDVPAGPR
jgi:hypothetical protein